MKRKRRNSRNSLAHPGTGNAARAASASTGIDVQTPLSVVFGDVEGCVCPICAEDAFLGRKQIVIDDDGLMREIQPKTPDMMTVQVRAHSRLSMHLRPDTMEVEVPVGCCLQDLLEYLRFKNQSLQRDFAPGALRGTIDGKAASGERALEEGQVVLVDGTRDPEWSQMMSSWSAGIAQS